MTLLFPDSPLPLVHHVQPAPSPTPRAERPIPTGLDLIDDAVGGVVPGALLVVTALSAEIRRTVAVALAVTVAQRRREPVLLASADLQGQDLVARAHTAARQGSLPWTAMERTGGRKRLSRTPPVAIATDTPDAAAVAARLHELAAPARLVVVLDPDRDGTLAGEAPRQAFQQLAGALGVPVVLLVSGTAPGWADPGDAHVGLVRTHLGETERFLARGVPAASPEAARFEVAVTPGRVLAHRLPATHLLEPAGRQVRWAPERDFDGVHRPRPTAVPRHELSALLADPEGAPRDADHALRVVLALTAAHHEADDRDALLAHGAERVAALLLRAAAIAGRRAAVLWGQARLHLGRVPGAATTTKDVDVLLTEALAARRAARAQAAEVFRAEAADDADAAQQRLAFAGTARGASRAADAPEETGHGREAPTGGADLREARLREREAHLREREASLRWREERLHDELRAERERLRAARRREEDAREDERSPDAPRAARQPEGREQEARRSGRGSGAGGPPPRTERGEPPRRGGYDLEALRRAMRANATDPNDGPRPTRREEE